MNQMNLAFPAASAVQDATGLSGPALIVLLLVGILLVFGVSTWYTRRRRNRRGGRL